MKVLLVNGSPNAQGCTYTALSAVDEGLRQQGISSEVFQLGGDPVQGCMGCGGCRQTMRCIYDNDPANRLIDAILAANGVVLGSPVYYAGPNGALCAVLDRAFYAGARQFAGKVGAAVVSCRRAGSTPSLDRLWKYFTNCQMPIVSSQYWPMVHGHVPDEVRRDEEGLQIMRTLGRNMGWLLKCTEGKPMPEHEPRVATNFIR